MSGFAQLLVLADVPLTAVVVLGLVPRGGELLFFLLPVPQLALGLLSLAAGGWTLSARVSGRGASTPVGSAPARRRRSAAG